MTVTITYQANSIQRGIWALDNLRPGREQALISEAIDSYNGPYGGSIDRSDDKWGGTIYYVGGNAYEDVTVNHLGGGEFELTFSNQPSEKAPIDNNNQSKEQTVTNEYGVELSKQAQMDRETREILDTDDIGSALPDPGDTKIIGKSSQSETYSEEPKKESKSSDDNSKKTKKLALAGLVAASIAVLAGR